MLEFNFLTFLLSYFLIYSFLGWILESVYKSILQKKYVNSGFVFGPFCPIYGFGAIILYLFLDGFKENLVLVFLIGMVIFSIWECLVGYWLERVFDAKYWDYTNEKFNFKGRICLRMSFVWGLLGVIFTYLLHPFISNFVQRIPADILAPIAAIILLSVIIDFIISGIKVKNIDIKLSRLKDVQANLNLRLAELKKLQNIKALATKSIQLDSLKKTIEDLRQTERVLKYKINKRIVKLKSAFPTMKSQKITEFLNQKFEAIKKEKKRGNYGARNYCNR